MDKNIKEYFETNGIPLTEDKVKEFNEASYNNMISIQKVDYKQLLSKYMDLVYEKEGTDLLMSVQHNRTEINFTDEEKKALKNIE